MDAIIKNGNLIITIPCDEKASTKSVTGKTYRVASSEGNKPVALKINGQNVIIGLNAYIKAVPAAAVTG